MSDELTSASERYSSSTNVVEAVEQLAKSCRDARTRLGISQEEVAARAGVTIATYGCIERGRSLSGMPANPTMDTLVRVLEVLGLEALLSVRDTG